MEYFDPDDDTSTLLTAIQDCRRTAFQPDKKNFLNSERDFVAAKSVTDKKKICAILYDPQSSVVVGTADLEPKFKYIKNKKKKYIPEGVVTNVFVRPDQRGKKFGKQLMMEGIEEILVQQLLKNVNSNNPDDNDNERDDSAGIDSDEDIGDSDNGIIKSGKRGKNGEVVDKIRKVSSKAEDEAVSRIMTLLAKVAYRLPRRPARGVELAQWIRAVLTIVVEFCDSDRGKGGNNKQIGRDVADRLGPIRNLLGERLETMPALLKLEGRLGLLTWAGMSS